MSSVITHATDEDWAFEARLIDSIAAQPGATFEDRLDALATLEGWEWLNEPIEVTSYAKEMCAGLATIDAPIGCDP